MNSILKSRSDAGRHLAARLQKYSGDPDAVVVGIPRSGLPVASEIATALGLPLDVVSVCKLPVPGEKGVTMGAVASGGVRSVDEKTTAEMSVSSRELATVASDVLAEVERRERLYRAAAPRIRLEARTVLLVDDGILSGHTVRAALAAIRDERPARVVVATAVAPAPLRREFETLVDEVVALETPEEFYAVSPWFAEAQVVTDDDVAKILRRARSLVPAPGGTVLAKAAAAAATPAAAPAPETVSAVDAAEVDPRHYRLLLENDRVRVLEYHTPPGEASPMHIHPDAVFYSLTRSRMRVTDAEGEAIDLEFAPGEVLWLEQRVHSTANVGATEARFVIVEIKAPEQPIEGTWEEWAVS